MTPAEALEHGWKLQQAGDLAGAERVYRQVLQVEPQNANAWCYFGMACHDQQRYDEAVAAYQNAVRLQPNFPIAFNNLGNTLRQQRRLKEALASFDQALRLRPDYVNAIKNRATTLLWEGFIDEAVTTYERVMQLAPDDAETHKNLGVVRLLQGRFAEGWPDYEWRWKLSDTTPPAFPQPRWDGASLDGRTILLTAEQGLGDTIHFVRYSAVLKQRFDCRTIVACQRALLPLLQSCAGIDRLVAQGDEPSDFDVWAPLLSVPAALGHNSPADFPAAVPYLSPDAARVAEWHDRLKAFGGFKIGLAWQGNPQHQADRIRSVPLAEFAPLGKLHGVRLFSLQKGVGVEQLDTIGARLEIERLPDDVDSAGAFVDTAAMMRNLDVVITSDTAIVHVAGAIGVPVWVALPLVPDWRWLLGRDDSPWYPTMRLFRQTTVGDWPSAIAKIVAALPEIAPAIRKKQPDEYRVATTGHNRLTRARHGLLLYNRHDIYIGRSLDRYGEFSEGEVDVFRQLLRPGHVVVEAGANIGVHTVAIARCVGDTGRVVAFEPQRSVFQTLCANVALNSLTNVDCRLAALGEQAGSLFVPQLDVHRDNNFGGLGLGEYQTGEHVPVESIDRLSLSRCDFIKADMEGMELAVLRGAAATIAKFRPILYVENDRQDKSPALIEYLLSLGYQLYWHLPPLFNAGNFFENPLNEFGNIASVNMLCVHSSVKSAIQGLMPVNGLGADWRTAR